MNGQAGQLWVIKIGGAAVDQPAVARRLMRQLRLVLDSGVQLVLVHGGGQRLTATAERLGLTSTFVHGRRLTDEPLLEVAKMVFAGGCGTDLAAMAHAEGVAGVALSGVAAGLLAVVRRPPKLGVDFGLVGDVTSVAPRLLTTLTREGFVPLVASLGVDPAGLVYNVNADTVACALAGALKASRLIVMTEFDGVRQNPEDAASRVAEIAVSALRSGTTGLALSGGMLPKLEALAGVIDQGVGDVRIVSWHHPEVLAALATGDAMDVGTVLKA